MKKLPNADLAVIAERKITGYLLSPSHPDGASKAAFLERFGFEREAPGALEAALLRHAREAEVVRVERTPYGTKYVVDGPLNTPDGRNPGVLAVWLVEMNQTQPRLVTAYPSEGR
jgi:hypothetical protein